MRKPLVALLLAGTILACTQKPMETNPLLVDYGTAYNIPPFDKINASHFMPAFKEGMAQHNAEIELIINSSETPSFENTILALPFCGSPY